MTLRDLNACLRESELVNGDNPLDRLTAIIAVLRTANQREIATSDGILCSVNKFVENFGPITTASVDEFVEPMEAMMEIDILDDYLMEILEAD